MAPEQISELAKLIAEHGLPPNWEQWGIFLAFLFVALCLAAYVGAHFGKRGEIGAITRKLDDVVTQQRAITAATATINSNIARLDWLDQRKWEVKQKFYWDLLTVVFNMAYTYRLTSQYFSKVKMEDDTKEQKAYVKMGSEFAEEAYKLHGQLRNLIPIAGVIVSASIAKALAEYSTHTGKMGPDKPAEYYQHLAEGAADLYMKCKLAAQVDLQLSSHSDNSEIENAKTII